MSESFGHILDQADAAMLQARGCLLRPTPESLDLCLTSFEHAAAALRELETSITRQTPPAHLAAAMDRFRRQLRRNQTLLACAADLRFGARQAEIATAGFYNRQVQPAVTAHEHRVSLDA